MRGLTHSQSPFHLHQQQHSGDRMGVLHRQGAIQWQIPPDHRISDIAIDRLTAVQVVGRCGDVLSIDAAPRVRLQCHGSAAVCYSPTRRLWHQHAAQVCTLHEKLRVLPPGVITHYICVASTSPPSLLCS